MRKEFEGAVEALFHTFSESKYNISLGSFVSYDEDVNDKSGQRFCKLNLHFKEGKNLVDLTAVPILVFGSSSSMDDVELKKDDTLMVFFADRTLDQWKSSGIPQTLTAGVKDSINNAFCIPVSSHHDYEGITSEKATVVSRKIVKEGTKVQIGNKNAELVKILNETLEGLDTLLTLLQGDVDNPGTASTGTLIKILPDLANLQTKNTERKTLLDEITKT